MTEEQKACQHKMYRQDGEVVEATCYSDGYQIVQWKCSICGADLGYYRVHTAGRKEHSYTEKSTTVNGCTQTTVYTCSGCGAIREEKEEQHQWKEERVSTDIACGKQVQTWLECAKCGAKKDVQTKNELNEHVFASDWTERSPATCTSPRVMQRTCVCGHVTQTMPDGKAKGHQWGEWDTQEATCEEPSSGYRACKTCGAKEYKDAQNDALGHDYKVIKKTEPTCVLSGETVEQCQRCQKERKTTVQPLGHSSKTLKSDASSHWRECDRCGHVFATEAHNFGEPKNPDSCTTTIECINCGYVQKTGTHHTWVWEDVGDKHKRSCSVCGALDGEYPHDMSYEGDCTSAKHCTVCGHVEEGSAKPGHAYGPWQDDGTNGHSRKCAVCGHRETGSHAYAWVTTKEPTPNALGLEVGTCVCGRQATRDIPKTPSAPAEEAPKPKPAAKPAAPAPAPAPETQADAALDAASALGSASVETLLEQGTLDVSEDVTLDFKPVESAAVVGGETPEIKLVVRAASIPERSAGQGDAYAAFAVALEKDGAYVSPTGTVRVSVPVSVGKGADGGALSVPTGSFKLVRVDQNGAVLTEIAFRFEDGVLTFDMEENGVYMLIPV